MKRIKAIIVDDEGLVRAGITKLIETASTEIEICGEAGDGEEAKELIKNVCPQLVFTDIVMPRIDGIELLKWIISFDPCIVSVVLSSYQDFDYVKRAFLFGASNYILKYNIDKEGIIPVINDALKMIRSRMDLEQYDKQSIVKEHIYSTRAAEAGYSMVAMYVQGSPDNAAKTQKVIKDISQKDVHDIMLYYGDSPKVYGYGKSETIIKFIHSATQQADRLGLCFLTGRADGQAGDTPLALKSKADCALDRWFFDNSQKSSVFKDISAAEKDRLHLLEERLKNSIVGDSTQNPEVIFKEFCNILKGLHTLTAIKVKLIFISLLEMLMLKYSDIIHEYAINTEAAELTILGSETLENCEQTMGEFMNSVIDNSIDLLDLRCMTSPVKSAALYINRNFADCDLTVNKIANEIKYSSQYVSRQFKVECGINLVDYITKVRINNAKRLLDKGEKRVFRVADNVGFNNYNYFSKVFKKVLGCTPSDYMEKEK